MITNKYAYFDYKIESELEAGIALIGDEVKAVRSNRVNLKGAYAKIFYNSKNNPEVFLVGSHFHSETVDPYRTRKLLLKKIEIERLIGKTSEKGLTLLPLKMYFKKGLVKVLLGLGKGKKKFDKREALRKRDAMQRINISLKQKTYRDE